MLRTWKSYFFTINKISYFHSIHPLQFSAVSFSIHDLYKTKIHFEYPVHPTHPPLRRPGSKRNIRAASVFNTLKFVSENYSNFELRRRQERYQPQISFQLPKVQVFVWKELKTQVLNWKDNKADISLENTDFLVVFLKALPRMAFGLPSPYYASVILQKPLVLIPIQSLLPRPCVYCALAQPYASLQMLVIIIAWW